ncbi:MAG: 2-C-methyl-D-erythritol 4-phosphate cytidylyltransferase, partial [Cytophagales bacterium]|nr:2-C-methyl-D-erythritol 4-phosphate cytidylyltransferase [Armatimonadota bacterium]
MCALIPAAGRGVRFGGSENKVFAPLLGRPLLAWTLQAFADCEDIDRIVLIGSEADLPRLRQIGEQYTGGKQRIVVEGGADRQSSVRLGLVACEDSEFIVVHDAARPCVTPALIADSLLRCRVSGAVTTAVPVADSLLRVSPELPGETVDRTHLWAVQTPQTFRGSVLREAHDAALRGAYTETDDLGLVRRLGLPWEILPGSSENLKVTRSEDLALVEAVWMRRNTPPSLSPALPSPRPAATMLSPTEGQEALPADAVLAAQNRGEGSLRERSLGDQAGAVRLPFRIGYGYDVHPFAEGRPMYLGGVHFPEAARGLQG